MESLEDEWKDFLRKKKIIGYDIIIEEIENKNIKNLQYEEIEKIKKKIEIKTIQYIKKQRKFIKKMKKEVDGRVEWKNIKE